MGPRLAPCPLIELMVHASQRQFHRCDLVLQPPGLGRFGLFDVNAREEIFAIRLETGREALPEIRRLLGRSSLVSAARAGALDHRLDHRPRDPAGA